MGINTPKIVNFGHGSDHTFPHADFTQKDKDPAEFWDWKRNPRGYKERWEKSELARHVCVGKIIPKEHQNAHAADSQNRPLWLGGAVSKLIAQKRFP